MTRTKQSPKGEDALENRIEAALQPGHFISDQAGGSFVRGLEDVEKEIERLIGREAHQALRLYETFLAGCHEKAEEVDDSSGGFGDFVQELFCGWIRARQASGANSEETAARLLAWMDDDPYGFCHDIERRAAEALDTVGLAALGRQVKDRFDKAV